MANFMEFDCRLCKWNGLNTFRCHDNCGGNYKKPHFEVSTVPVCIDGTWYNPDGLLYKTQVNNKVL